MSWKLGALTALLLLTWANAQEQSSIAGRVVDTITGQPLKRAHIRLLVGEFHQTPTAVYGAMSDSDGRFSISPIPAGSYLVQPELSGYFYLPKSFTVAIKAGERLDDYRIELTPRAILSGRVLDEHGEPVKDANIWPEAQGAALNLAMRRFDYRTSELGEFRLAVPPGKYRLRAQVFDRQEIRSDGTLAPAYYATTYYPNSSPANAELVDARPGKETSGLEIRLIRLRSLSISGTVTGATPGTPVAVHIRPEMEFDSLTIPAGKDGSFAAGDLAPGAYYIYAESGEGGEKWRSAELDFYLDNDTSNVSLSMARPFSLTGKLTGGPHAIVHLEAGGWGNSRKFSAPVAPDGTFHFDQLQPDRYTLTLSAAPEDGYIRLVELDGAAIEAREAEHSNRDEATTPAFGIPLDFIKASGSASLKVVVAPGARISGTVQGKSGVLADGLATVELLAEGQRSVWLITQPGKDGAYVFHAIPPGKYRIFAEHRMESEGADTDFRKLADSAEEIELHEGDRMTKDLTVIEGTGDAKKQP
jgi:hypothetical protein